MDTMKIAAFIIPAFLFFPPEHRFHGLDDVVRNDPDISAVFEGRTPCDQALLDINGMSMRGCNRVKIQLTLYQNEKTLEPTSFKLASIYVGTGDSVYVTSGRCTVIQDGYQRKGTVYHLTVDKTRTSLFLLKGDDNVLFVLDNERRLKVGNKDLSFTLNKVEKG
jgi:hypothetical protein